MRLAKFFKEWEKDLEQFFLVPTLLKGPTLLEGPTLLRPNTTWGQHCLEPHYLDPTLLRGETIYSIVGEGSD